MADKRMTIGLFICNLDNDYAYDICKGVDYAVKELGINLIVFPGMYINARYHNVENSKYDYQYNSIFYYAQPESIDALIISIGTIGTFLSCEEIQAFLNHFKGIPILTLELPIPGYASLSFDAEHGLRDLINHLIYEHNKKLIGFVSGPKDNSDAQLRVEIYKSALAEAGLPVNEDFITYGDFSDYCEDSVEELLDAHPEIDALCFANDQMVLAGYRVLSRRGITIGKDIAVTGFDDVSLASALQPTLSTVRANSTELGYHAVKEILSLIQTGKTNTSHLNSAMILRNSCGCTDHLYLSDRTQTALDSNHDKQQTINYIVQSALVNDKTSFVYNRIADILVQYVSLAWDTIFDSSKTVFPTAELLDVVKDYIQSDLPLYFSVIQLSNCFQIIDNLLLSLIQDTQKRFAYHSVSTAVFMQLLNAESSARYNESRNHKLNNRYTTSYIIRDTMDNSNDAEAVFWQLADKLQQIGLNNSYIFTTPQNAIHQNQDGSWHIPNQLQLQVCTMDDTIIPLTKQACEISIQNLFHNPYMPQTRRFTMVLTPIFTNADHHGLFLCEIDISKFQEICSISMELGTALQFLKMQNAQQETNRQLEYTLSVLHEKNQQLSKISTIDELTGLKNRRGFLTETQTIISSPLNYGKRAILLFADMDNLKVINDKFGHENGDFSLRTIATALKSSLRNNDIVGRIGGDEFVAFAMLGEQQSAESISSRIRSKLATMSKSNDKPYHIDASIGIVDFICNETVDIHSLLKQADMALYENKSRKRISVLKEDL